MYPNESAKLLRAFARSRLKFLCISLRSWIVAVNPKVPVGELYSQTDPLGETTVYLLTSSSTELKIWSLIVNWRHSLQGVYFSTEREKSKRFQCEPRCRIRSLHEVQIQTLCTRTDAGESVDYPNLFHF